jgi:hypothetical protein
MIAAIIVRGLLTLMMKANSNQNHLPEGQRKKEAEAATYDFKLNCAKRKNQRRFYKSYY